MPTNPVDTRWALFTDFEIAVLWRDLLYDDGIRYWPDAIDVRAEDELMRQIMAEAERRWPTDEPDDHERLMNERYRQADRELDPDQGYAPRGRSVDVADGTDGTR